MSFLVQSGPWPHLRVKMQQLQHPEIDQKRSTIDDFEASRWQNVEKLKEK